MSSPTDDLTKYRDFLIDIYSKAYDRAAAYTNLIMLGGYAGGFAIWNFTRAHLTPNASAAAALCLLSSLTIFVLFEVYKMVVNTRHNTKVAELLKQQKPISELMADVQTCQKELMRDNFFSLQRVWAASLLFSVITALVGIGILMWNFLTILFS